MYFGILFCFEREERETGMLCSLQGPLLDVLSGRNGSISSGKGQMRKVSLDSSHQS